jgi:hypothetical protein
MPLLAGVAALTLLAGCGEQEAPPVNITTVEVDNSTNITVPAGNAAEPAADNATDGNSVAAQPSLVLAPDGVATVLENGATRRAGFGVSRDIAVPIVSAVLGKPVDTGRNGECGQGPMEIVTFKGGIDLEFQDGKFVGWDLDGREKGGYRTAKGIGVGSSLRELRAAYSGVTVENSSLGDEFGAGDLGGLLTSLKPDATITHMWAGSVCQFR